MRHYYISDTIAKYSGSWWFIAGLSSFITGWMVLAGTYDPYPYILLNLFISVICVLQAPFILMTQWRNEARDRARMDLVLRKLSKAEELQRHIWTKVSGGNTDKLIKGGYGMRYFNFNGRKVACALTAFGQYLDYYDGETGEPIQDLETIQQLDEKTTDLQHELLEERSLLKNQFEAYMD